MQKVSITLFVCLFIFLLLKKLSKKWFHTAMNLAVVQTSNWHCNRLVDLLSIGFHCNETFVSRTQFKLQLDFFFLDWMLKRYCNFLKYCFKHKIFLRLTQILCCPHTVDKESIEHVCHYLSLKTYF